MTKGISERDCPFCDGLDVDESSVPSHIRYNCEVVVQWRVDNGLPAKGYGGPE